MSVKWSEYKYRQNAKITERYHDLVVYRYYDEYYAEERYAVVLEGTIMLNTKEYPSDEIHRIADVYKGILTEKTVR